MRAARWVAALCVCAGLLGALPVSGETEIDNSDLLPAYVPNDQVQYKGDTPDWADGLILAQFRIETATEEGTLEAAVKVLDHYAEMGVNGLMILPVADRPLDSDGNGYRNWGPDTIWSKITGTTDYEVGWKKFKTFVDEAHKRDLRVIVDIVTWGLLADSPVVKAHRDWFKKNTQIRGGYECVVGDWSRKGIIDHWANALVAVAKKTGLDGYRCDCEPNMSGYALYGIVRDRALHENGQKLLIMSETVSTRRDKSGNAVYDFEQWGGVTYHDRTQSGWGNRLMENRNTTFTEHYNIVDAIKTKGNPAICNDGKDRLYVNMLSCHDNRQTVTLGSRVYMGYQAIFAPFIPMWYIGEEWNNPDRCTGTGVLYFNKIDWARLDDPENRAFFEDIKRMIRVRRQYPEVFTCFPDSVRDANICKVTTNRDDLQAYARWYGDTAVLIVPNTDDVRASRKFTVTVPWKDMGMNAADKAEYLLIDGMTGKQLGKGTRAELTAFSANIGTDAVGVFVIKPDTTQTTATTTTVTTATTSTTTVATTAAATATSAVTTFRSTTVTAATTHSGDTSATATVTTAPIPTGTVAPTAPVDTDGGASVLPAGLLIGIGAGAAVLLLPVWIILSRRKRV